MDQPSETSNDNPFKPEEEASFNESMPEVTIASAPLEIPSASAVQEPVQPFTPVAPVAPVGSFAPQAPTVPSMTEEPEPTSAQTVKKNKKWLPLAIAGGALVLMSGGASAYYFGVYQNPDNVLYDAFTHLESAKAMQASGSVSFDMPVMSGVKLKSIDYSGNFENNPSGTLSITAKLTLMSADVSVGGKGMFVDSGNLYFQLTGLEDAFRAYVSAMGASDSDVPASFYASLGELQDQWVKVTLDDIKKSSAEAATTYKCTIDAYKKHKDDSSKPVLEAYKKNAFLSKKEDLGVKDGRIGYKMALDTVKAKAFAESIKDTELAKDVRACDSSIEEDTTTEMDTSSAGDVTTNVWIDQWSHELKRVEYNGNVGESTSKVSYNGNVDVAYDKNVITTAPSGSITLDEFATRLQDVGSGLSGAPDIDVGSV